MTSHFNFQNELKRVTGNETLLSIARDFFDLYSKNLLYQAVQKLDEVVGEALILKETTASIYLDEIYNFLVCELNFKMCEETFQDQRIEEAREILVQNLNVPKNDFLKSLVLLRAYDICEEYDQGQIENIIKEMNDNFTIDLTTIKLILDPILHQPIQEPEYTTYQKKDFPNSNLFMEVQKLIYKEMENEKEISKFGTAIYDVGASIALVINTPIGNKIVHKYQILAGNINKHRFKY